jgi:ATPase family associated with various cellular activities (AAA)
MHIDEVLRMLPLTFLQHTQYAWALSWIMPFLWMNMGRITQYCLQAPHNFRRKNIIELSGTVDEDKYDITAKFSKRLRALIFYTNKTCMDDPRLRRLIEIFFDNHSCQDDIAIQTEYLIDQDIPLKLTDTIYCRFCVKQKQHHEDKRTHNTRHINVTLYSEKATVKELKAFLTDIEGVYDEHVKMQMNSHQFCFTYLRTEESGKITFNTNRFSSTKTFENLVSVHKAPLIERLDFFANNKAYYAELGIPYTLGMLLHGVPGVGKSSTVKAIANHTGRHLIVIPMTKMRQFNTLRQIMLNDEIEGFTIPNHKRLYIFEEIDCNGMQHVIMKRSPSQSQTSDVSIATLESVMTKMGIGPKEKLTDHDPITLGSFLELLDGINEAPGRIIVMTTNKCPDNFDDALLRPGRIDMTLEFKRCTKQEIDQLYKLWFKRHIPSDVLRNIPDYTHTPAELGEMFIKNINDADAILKCLLLKDEHVA